MSQEATCTVVTVVHSASTVSWEADERVVHSVIRDFLYSKVMCWSARTVSLSTGKQLVEWNCFMNLLIRLHNIGRIWSIPQTILIKGIPLQHNICMYSVSIYFRLELIEQIEPVCYRFLFFWSCRERRAGGVRRNVNGETIYHIFKLWLMNYNITIFIILKTILVQR